MLITGTDLLRGEYNIRLYKDDASFIVIKCKISEAGFSLTKEGQLNCIVTLSPLEDLPEWYNYEDYTDDFELPIDCLWDNQFWPNTEQLN